MLVQANAPGLRLDELSLRGSIVEPAQRSAQGLAWLHRCQALAGDGALLSRYTLDDETRGLAEYRARLAQARSDALPAVAALHAALLERAAILPPAPRAVPLHRDFYYSQVIFDGPRLQLIDFDLLALGDPAIDVANFSAHLAYLGLEQFGDLQRFAGAARRFCDAYCAAGVVDDAFPERVAFYQAATLFRLLSVVVARPALQHLFEPLLAHAGEQHTLMGR